MLTLLLYLCVFIFSVLLAGLYQHSKDKGELKNKFVRMIFRMVVVLPPAILIGLRGLNVGYDTEAMTYLLFSGPFSLDYLLENQHDPLSILFAHVANIVFIGNESAYLFSISFITLFIMFAAIEKWSDLISIPFALMVYYLYFALIGMDQFKQVFSMSILFYAIAKLRSHNDVQFFVLTTIAGFFHSTSFSGYVLYFFRFKGKKKPVLKAVMLICILIATLYPDALFSQLSKLFGEGAYSMYFSGRFYDQAQGAENTGLRFVLDIVPCIFPLFFRKVFPDDIKWMLTLSLLVTMPLRALGYEAEFLHRVYYDPALAIILAYPAVWAGLPANRKPIFLVCSLALLGAYYFVAFSTSHGVTPYAMSIL